MLGTFLSTLATRLAAGGVAVAMATTGVLAAGGNLPNEAQSAVSQAVDNIGIDLPDPQDIVPFDNVKADLEADVEVEDLVDMEADLDADIDDDSEESGKEGEGDDVSEGEDSGEGENEDSFGQMVSADARRDSDGERGVDGGEVSRAAHERNEQRWLEKFGNTGPGGSAVDHGDDDNSDDPEDDEDEDGEDGG